MINIDNIFLTTLIICYIYKVLKLFNKVYKIMMN